LLVWSFNVHVISGDAKREFVAETDAEWNDFRDKVISRLDDTTEIKLTYKMVGEPGKPSHLSNADDFRHAMERVGDKARGARTKAAALEIKNSSVSPQ
jgi:hypothetical protein